MRLKEEETLLDEVPDYEDDPTELDTEEEDDEDGEILEESDKQKELPAKQDNTELAALRAEIAAAKAEADVARQEALNEKHERQKAQYYSVKAHVDKLQSDDKAIRSQIRTLQGELEEARAGGETSRVKELLAKIDEKSDVRSQIEAEVNKYTPMLANAPADAPEKVTARESTKSSLEEEQVRKGQQRLEDWMDENRSWYDNPAFAAKRQKAHELCEQNVKNKYEPHTAVFWRFIDNELEKFDGVKRRSKPMVRGAVGSGEQQTRKKTGDAEVMKQTNRILAQMGYTSADKGTPEFDKKSVAVYKSVVKNLPKYQKKASA